MISLSHIFPSRLRAWFLILQASFFLLFPIRLLASELNCSVVSNSQAHSLKASYQASIQQLDYPVGSWRPRNKVIEDYSMIYWRSNNKVAYQYPERKITEFWQLEINRQLSFSRLFDAYQRGIEYEPGDLKMLGQGKQRWEFKRNLLSPKMLAGKIKATELKTVNQCRRVQYQGSIGGDLITLIWNPDLELVLEASIVRAKTRKKMSYKLTGLQNSKAVQQRFNQLANYDMMDFSDIGDNEADPFISKMIRLGFIEHFDTNILNERGERISPYGSSHSH